MFVNDRAKNLADKALKGLSDSLAAGHSETLISYLRAMSRFRTYSWFNSVLIYFQRPDATHVAGFHQWKKMRRYVSKGERGIVIVAPMRFKASTQKPLVDEEVDTLVGFTSAYVFDIAQTEGESLPEFAQVKGDPGEFTSKLKDLVEEKGLALSYSPDLGGAKGVSRGGHITLLSDLEPGVEFNVLAHELAHELLHRGERRPPKQVRELEAEAVAFVASSAIGLDTSTSSADYIHLYQGDDKLLANSLRHIHLASEQILTRLL